MITFRTLLSGLQRIQRDQIVISVIINFAFNQSLLLQLNSFDCRSISAFNTLAGFRCPSEFGPLGTNPGTWTPAGLVSLRRFGTPIIQLIYFNVYQERVRFWIGET